MHLKLNHAGVRSDDKIPVKSWCQQGQLGRLGLLNPRAGLVSDDGGGVLCSSVGCCTADVSRANMWEKSGHVDQRSKADELQASQIPQSIR